MVVRFYKSIYEEPKTVEEICQDGVLRITYSEEDGRKLVKFNLSMKNTSKEEIYKQFTEYLRKNGDSAWYVSANKSDDIFSVIESDQDRIAIEYDNEHFSLWWLEETYENANKMTKEEKIAEVERVRADCSRVLLYAKHYV